MKIDITHSVRRVLQHSVRFRKHENDSQLSEPFDITSLGVLLALIDEEECRASIWLTEYDIDRKLISGTFQWDAEARFQDENGEINKNTENERKFPQRIRFFLDGDATVVGRLEPSLLGGIFLVAQNLHDLIPQVVFATEHLLYALSLAEDETAAFLYSHNATPESLFEKICRQEGIDISEPEILRVVWDEPPDPNEPGFDTQGFGKIASVPDGSAAVYRILDASANRAIEAIRVLEDYVRFGLDNVEMASLTKQMRHELASALRELPRTERLTARSVPTDVGTGIEGANEYHRSSLTDVLGANFSRLQESLRSLEEYGKIVAERLARTAERLRYQSYTLQKIIPVPHVSSMTACDAKQRLLKACLYVLVDCRKTETEFVVLVQAVIEGGVDVIQLRDKRVDDRLLLRRAGQLRDLTAGTQTLMIVNDRPDMALLCRADGVHVGQDELVATDVRKIVGAEMLVGVSTHSVEQARQAVHDGADYLGAGPVFPSSTKSFDVFPGTEFLRQIAAEMPHPVFAVGGIDLDNLSRVLDTGLRRVAVQSVVTESNDPAATCRQLKTMLQRKATKPCN